MTAQATSPSLGTTTTQRPLAGKWMDLLRDGDIHDNHGAPYAACMAFAVAAHRAGWTHLDYAAEMTDPNNRLGDHYRRKDDGRRRSTKSAELKIRRDWGKASGYVAEHPPARHHQDVAHHLGVVRAAAADTAWTGRNAIRDQVVLGVLLDIAEAKPTPAPTVSLRSLCELTPYRGNQTVMRALRSLAASGWLAPSRDRSEHDQPTAYRIMLPRVSENGATGSPPLRGDSAAPPSDTLVGRLHADLGIRFGARAAMVYASLDPDIPQRVVSVVRRSGVSRSTVNRWLPELAVMGLAYRTPDGWFQGPRDAELVAMENGALDLVEQRAIRHDLQRRGFREWHEARSTAPRRNT